MPNNTDEKKVKEELKKLFAMKNLPILESSNVDQPRISAASGRPYEEIKPYVAPTVPVGLASTKGIKNLQYNDLKTKVSNLNLPEITLAPTTTEMDTSRLYGVGEEIGRNIAQEQKTEQPKEPSKSLIQMVSEAYKGNNFSPNGYSEATTNVTSNPGNSSLLNEYADKIRKMMNELKVEKEQETSQTQTDRNRLDAEIQRRLNTPLARVNLSPIMAMVDAFTGSNISGHYQKPAGMLELLQGKLENTKSKFTAGKDYRKELLNALGLGTSLAKTQEDAETRRYVKELRANEESKASISDLRIRQEQAKNDAIKAWDTTLMGDTEGYANLSEKVAQYDTGATSPLNFVKTRIAKYYEDAKKAGLDPSSITNYINDNVRSELTELENGTSTKYPKKKVK